jgi:uncharacterized protein
MTHSEIISSALGINLKNVEATISLLDDGATIPFISRYRKEATGELDEVAIFDIQRRLEQLRELDKRKATIIATIAEQQKLTPDLEAAINATYDPSQLEDLYLPYKPKRRTRAQIAREHGLEPLAKSIMSRNGSFARSAARRYVNKDVATEDDAIAGASDIIAEWISENQAIRRYVRTDYERNATISVAIAKGKESDAANYLNYTDFSASLRRCSSHQVLAILRGANEGVLKYSVDIDNQRAIAGIASRTIKAGMSSDASAIIEAAVADSYKRLLKPSIENETIAAAKERADDIAINTFAGNLRQLLLASPLGHKRVLAIDPGFRTGCKVVCLDASGRLLHYDVIYPTAPKNDFKGAARKISYLLEAYKIEAISLGNGTASRETERFLKSMMLPAGVEVYVVNEAGASVYSASKIARDEFPDKDVTVRGAVSIGRRLIDPLAELVKIDPKSIGVGQYQHDVDQRKLKESLDMTVEACVNSVGVDLNTASPSLLSYVSGIGPAMATNIVDYRSEHGSFNSRRELMNVPRFGEKAFRLSAGFLRIPNADNILDTTAVHPESYHIVQKMAKDLGVDINKLVSDKKLIESIDLNCYVTPNAGLPTLRDIISELEKPGRDPRKTISVFSFDESIKDIADLRPGMILPGIVNNITEFGAFVDIGIHQSGLVHLSQMANRYVNRPADVVTLNQHVKVKVIDVDASRNRISLSMKDVEQ